ncbi:transglutaminase domain-containing protein [Micromonospora sp. NPDC005652]|uniref:transglutaminase domain-containing protein n=1 Tax=Micromonospora sp. NPDC005652 TaxID=3157046 RepID=UPI0033F3ED50
MRTADTPAATVITEAIAVTNQLRQIPLSARRLAIDADRARREFGTDHRVLDYLLDVVCEAGLPHSTDGKARLFDLFDLINLSLYLPLRTPNRAAMRFWGTVLNRPAGELRTYAVGYAPLCPMPGHASDCEFLLRTPDETAVRIRRPACEEGSAHTATVILGNDWPVAPAPVRRLLEEIGHVRLFRLPEILRWNTDFMLSTGIGDCAGMARLLTERAKTAGLAARLRYGLLVAPPYSMPHFWAEFHLDDRWVPYDPGLVNALVRWGVLNGDQWPMHRSPGAVLAGLSSRFTRVGTDRGFNAYVAFPTRLISKTTLGSRADTAASS